MGSYDENIRSFRTAPGAVTATYPSSANIDSATVMADSQTYAASYWASTDYPRLLQIICVPDAAGVPSAGTVLIIDNTPTVPVTILTFGFAADALNKIVTFPEGGIRMPKGGFGVTTTGNDGFIFVFSNTRAA